MDVDVSRSVYPSVCTRECASVHLHTVFNVTNKASLYCPLSRAVYQSESIALWESVQESGGSRAHAHKTSTFDAMMGEGRCVCEWGGGGTNR